MPISSRRATTRGVTKQGCPDSEEAVYADFGLRTRAGIANAPCGANLAGTPIRGSEGRANNDHERERLEGQTSILFNSGAEGRY